MDSSGDLESVFVIAVSERAGHIREHHRLGRSRFVPFFAERLPATVLLEACGSAHHWGRCLQELGHHVLLLPPHAVRPYVPRTRNDRADAQGLLEAFRHEEIRPVPVKSVAQQTLAALHRLRSAWLASRTARINTLRSLLREFGVAIPGVGFLTATALVAVVGDIQHFPSGRHFACFLGLTPREHSSGHRGHNKAAVALANKLARLVWAVWEHDAHFQEVAMAWHDRTGPTLYPVTRCFEHDDLVAHRS